MDRTAWFKNLDQRDYSENTENTPLMTPSSRADLNIDQERHDETRIVENFEDGDFSALIPNYDHKRAFITIFERLF